MNKHLIKMECLTGLHVGSGDVNFNIIDNEVEKDPVTGRPTINASGVKGAFRDAYKTEGRDMKRIFGSEGKNDDETTTGEYKFLNAELLTRPLRASGTGVASVPVTTIDTLNSYLRRLTGFGCNHYDIEEIVYSGDYTLLSRDGKVYVEGERTEKMPDKLAAQLDLLSDVLPANTVIAKTFDDYPLPVIARNCLDNGISKNLWYEEYVPQTSVFYTLILTDDKELDPALGVGKVVQFGGHFSIGYGFMKLTEIGR